MAKVELELVKRILKRTELEESVVSEILGELQSVVNDEAANTDEPKAAPVKKQFVVIVSDNSGILSNKEMMGWVLQLPEDEPMQSVSEKIARVAKAFNLSKKGRRYPVETVGETCENVPGRIFKEQKLWLKTKTPVLLVPMSNTLDLEGVELKNTSEDNFSDEEIF